MIPYAQLCNTCACYKYTYICVPCTPVHETEHISQSDEHCMLIIPTQSRGFLILTLAHTYPLTIPGLSFTVFVHAEGFTNWNERQ